MAQYKMSFKSFQEIIVFFKSKKCPICNGVDITRHFHKSFLGTKRGTRSNNLGKDNYYQSTAVYKCNNCNNSFTLDGLISGKAIDENDVLLSEGETKQQIKQRDNDVMEYNMKASGRIFVAVIVGMFSMLIYGAVASGDLILLAVFGPIVSIFAVVVFIIFSLNRKKSDKS